MISFYLSSIQQCYHLNQRLKTWDESSSNIVKYIKGELKQEVGFLINVMELQKQSNLKFLNDALEAPFDFIALDSETTGLYPRDGYMLGMSISYEPQHGAYIDTDCVDEECEELLQELFSKKRVVFHNAKFDLAFFEYHFGFTFPKFERYYASSLYARRESWDSRI